MNLPSFFHKPSADLDFLDDWEYYLPIRVPILLESMLCDANLSEKDRADLKTFTEMLEERFHYDYHKPLRELKNDFVPFDPDHDTIRERQFTENELEEKRIRIYRSIRQLLQFGNYTELLPEQLAECLKLQPIGGLSVHVDTTEFDEFHVYYRGTRVKTETERFLFFWKQTRQVTIFNRVFVLARFKKEYGGRLIVKIFKEVPVENIKIVAPKVKLGMPIFDQLKIGGTVFSSLATTLYKLFVAVTLSWVLFAIVLGGLLIAASKGIFSFLGSKTKYMHRFSSSLYYRSLSNNRAAIIALIDAAEEQETKETLLAYYVLFKHHDTGLSLEEINREVESWIEKEFNLRFRFEVDDAVRKLREKNIIQSENQLYRVFDLPETLRRLDETWDGLRSCQT